MSNPYNGNHVRAAARQDVLPPFRCPRVFSPGEHEVEFCLQAVSVVEVDKTVLTHTSGGQSGSLWADNQGRVHGSLSAVPVSTCHEVHYAYRVRDDLGLESRISLPDTLTACAGHRLGFVYGRRGSAADWVLLTVVNYTMNEVADQLLRNRADQVAEKVPPFAVLLRRCGLEQEQQSVGQHLQDYYKAFLVALACSLPLVGCLGAVVLGFANKEDGLTGLVCGVMAVVLIMAAVAALTFVTKPFFADSPFRQVRELYADEFKEHRRHQEALIDHCRACCTALAGTASDD
jgi:hypothetical protein